MEIKYKPATLATLQDDIEDLHKEAKKQQEFINNVIEELCYMFNIELTTKKED